MPKRGTGVNRAPAGLAATNLLARLSNMGKHLKNLLDGARQSLVIYPVSEYQRPARGDFRKDAQALRGDMARVGADLRRSLTKERHGQTYDR